MEFSELIKIRQSVRRYQDKPVERDKIDKLIESVRLAPSACNSQPWTLIVVDDPALKEQAAKTTYGPLVSFNRFVPQAPVLAVLVLEKPKLVSQIGGRIKNKEYSLIDIGIAAVHFCLQAAELGLGTCMLGWFDEKKIKKLFNIPSSASVGLMMTLGYAPEGYALREKKRKDIIDMCRFNDY